ncbi:MAG: sulfurtransferase TusA family protein [Methylacidiphilaceae bacterium]|nr:sulfurtransferase TusA family protein [Candidatus Methylacidiphilaceae bacterium]
MEELKITKESDARGSFCPGPLMEMIRLVRSANVGDVVAVISGDEGSKKDIPAWINKARYELIGMEDVASGGTRIICRKNH